MRASWAALQRQGQASEAAIHERTADQDPLKWRKYVSYAEFTPAKTPSEGHHIPGYSGVVPGMYAENLYAKTYGKATLQAVEGRFPRGVEQNADEQYKTSMEVAFNMDNGHPGKPSDIAHGGVSWAGASPYNLQTDATAEKLEPMNQWPPSTVQIAGGKEPVKTSVLMHNFHEGKDYSASSEPARCADPRVSSWYEASSSELTACAAHATSCDGPTSRSHIAPSAAPKMGS